MQVPLRAWPAGAVHDSAAAVFRTAPFARSVESTLLGRLLGWLGQGLRWLAEHLGTVPGGRKTVIWITATVAALIVVRLLLAARIRDPERRATGGSRAAVREDDPWRLAERLRSAGDHEGAAHALYRGVLSALARQERLRLHPSKTSGDYARELRARGSSAYAPFRAFARRFDDAVYGHGPVDALLVDDLLRLAAPLRVTARAA